MCLLPQGCERKAAKQKFILKVLMATWRSEISDCILNPQAYLHYKKEGLVLEFRD
jgi:hypothetical protein